MKFGLKLGDRGLIKSKSGIVVYLDIGLTDEAALVVEGIGRDKQRIGDAE